MKVIVFLNETNKLNNHSKNIHMLTALMGR